MKEYLTHKFLLTIKQDRSCTLMSPNGLNQITRSHAAYLLRRWYRENELCFHPQKIIPSSNSPCRGPKPMKTIKVIFNDKKRNTKKHGRFAYRTELNNATKKQIEQAIEILQLCLEYYPANNVIQ